MRTYGWIVILFENGLINNLLAAFGFARLRLIFNQTGVVIGLTEILMPYMILALMAGFGGSIRGSRSRGIARRLAAAGVPAHRRAVDVPGIALGSLLCFVLAVSSFITPKLLGGGRVFLLATEIYDSAIVTLNWPVAAALSIVILVIFGTALLLYTRALDPAT